MPRLTFKHLVFGFIAGAIAMVTVHELINFAILQAGVPFARTPWSVDPVPVKAGLTELVTLPRIVVDALIGGLWGFIFALILGPVPIGSMTLKGAVLGLVIPGVLGALILCPVIRGEEILLGNDGQAIAYTLLMAAGFGAATAWLYGFMAEGFRLP